MARPRVYERRQGKDGRKRVRYWIRYTGLDGKVHKRAAADLKKTADVICRNVEVALVEKDPLAVAAAFGDALDTDRTFRGAAKAWLAWAEKHRKPSTVRIRRSAMKHLLPAFGDVLLDQLTTNDLEDYVERRQDGGAANATVAIEIQTARAVVTRAVKRGLARKNPLGGFDKTPRSAKRTRVVTGEELDRLLVEIDRMEVRSKHFTRQHVRAFVMIALSSGMRRGEVLALRPSAVDLSTGRVHLADTKANRPQTRFIGPEGLAELKRLPRPLRDERWFSGLPERMNQLVRVACDAAGLHDVKPHTLRHSFGSVVVRNGTSLAVARDLLGHSSLEMLNRYAHTTESEMEEAARAVALRGGASRV